VDVVRGVSFEVYQGETLGIVGESGSGKSMMLAAIGGLARTMGADVRAEGLRFEGKDLMAASEVEWNRIRGARIGHVFQNPMTALNPVLSVGDQVSESLRAHDRQMRRESAHDRALELLELVGIGDAGSRFRMYPHQLSGGMQQRVLIAMAVSHTPSLVLADEPTTGLDVTIQAEVLSLLRELKERSRLSLVIVTHNLGVIAEVADRVLVMYGGQVMESATVRDLFHAPRHPYTASLLQSSPSHFIGERLHPIPGTPPEFDSLPAGCVFSPRCPVAEQGDSSPCFSERPRIEGIGFGSACHFPDRTALVASKRGSEAEADD
jgi:oligopeptide/dipeptide ABC transporter ATP-binding protein